MQQRLEREADPATRTWWERYLKQVIPFRGVKMQDVRGAMRTWYLAEHLKQRLSPAQHRALAEQLVREPVAEDKLAGILFLREVLMPAGFIRWRTDLKAYARLFDSGAIADWNSCDWFCVKVLGALIEQEGEACAQAVARWSRARNLWRRRASVVAFANLAGKGDALFAGFTETLLAASAQVLNDRERFAQTGVGWVLRELSSAERKRVTAFIEQHIDRFIAESLRSATARLPARTRGKLQRQHRDATKVRS